MTVLEELTREFGDAAVASAIVDSLLDNGMKILSGSVKSVRRGYTGARLVKALLANVSPPIEPRSCVIKYCPPAASHLRESRGHSAALRESPAGFQKHLAQIAFPPINCPRGALVIGQDVAEGDPLGAVEPDRLFEACEVIWKKVLGEWTGPDYESKHSTLADLLESELGDCFRTGGWLRDWARDRGLLVPELLQLPDEDMPLPNPWWLFAEDRPETQANLHYLVGRAHGDLHGDNVLVPVRKGRVLATGFLLIDLATYERRAPLSRDLATLLMSLSWREIGESSRRSQSSFLEYIEGGYRDESHYGGMAPDVRKIIDALREPAYTFVVETKKWEAERWLQQLRVSLLAQAMRHSTYASGGPDARRWCSLLACRLTRSLLGQTDSLTGPRMFFDAGDAVGATGSVATSRSAARQRHEPVFVDRTSQRRRLRATLEDQITSVIVVSGPPGIGKTALVREVLAELGRPDPDDDGAAVRWHNATRYGGIDVPILVEDIEPPGFGQVAGPAARARLEIALDALDKPGRTRPIIVIDAAENLLDGESVLRDAELDLALEAVHGRLRSCIKIVFVTQCLPKATTGSAWIGTACRIDLEGLEQPSVREHFAKLDPGDSYGFASLPENELRSIHGRLAGNPRLAELLHAVLSCDPPGLQVHEVGPWLCSMPANEVHQRLICRLVDYLPLEQRLVAKGLAALGIPVGTDVVVGVLDDYMLPLLIEPALQALTATRLVLEDANGRRYLRKSEIEAILGHREPSWSAGTADLPTAQDLVVRAAEMLEPMQKDDGDVHGMADLDMHFARVDAWLRAGMHDIAYGLIETMAPLVDGFGSGVELRTHREAVRGRLGDERECEMINLAALGDIYSAGGDFPSARQAYQDSLVIAKEDQNREAMRRIYIGMGTMFWERDRLADAEEHFRWALGLASDHDADGGDRGAALIGLADCEHQRGHYRRAVADALDALEATWECEPGPALDAASRLTTWYAELDQIPEALTMLARCRQMVLDHPSERADLLNLTADTHLYMDRFREGQAEAVRAVTLAREARLPVQLRRSLTTLALAHLHMGNFEASREAIEESARYRLAGRETIGLALRAIIAHRCGLPGTARDLFQQLHEETGNRIEADTDDLAAWDFTGVIRCYAVLVDGHDPARAVTAFENARSKQTEPTPGLDDRVRYMVQMLANGDARLDRVFVELARIRPGRTG